MPSKPLISTVSAPPPRAVAKEALTSPSSSCPSQEHAIHRTPSPMVWRDSRSSPHTRSPRAAPSGIVRDLHDRSSAMSPLAVALQAQWRQLQQDLVSPSVLHHENAAAYAANVEREILRVLSSITARVDMAVSDAVNTVPYLLALGQAPLPSLRTQVVALAALRGVLSSLPGVYGEAAVTSFLHDFFLGSDQALQGLNAAALMALEALHSSASTAVKSNASADHKVQPSCTPPKMNVRTPTKIVRDGYQRSLLSHARADASGMSMGAAASPLRVASESLAGREPSIDAVLHRSLADPVACQEPLTLRDKSAELRGQVLHACLLLFRDVMEQCGPVLDAFLSYDVLLKACLDNLDRLPVPLSSVSVGDGARSASYVGQFRLCQDVLSLLLTLLAAEPQRHNEAALILSGFGAPRAVCALAQRLVHAPLGVSGEIRVDDRAVVTEDATATLMWDALKIMGWLTRSCPPAMKAYLSENPSIPSFGVQALTVSVAEVREATALWMASLLETQAKVSTKIVAEMLSDAAPLSDSTAISASASPPSTIPPPVSVRTAVAPVPAVMVSLLEMLRWRGAQMYLYGVSAIVCWRWMLLSAPSQVAALLLRDSGLIATLLNLMLRCAPSTNPSAETSPTSLPTRLTALEALHVLTLSYALGSLDTRARLRSRLVQGPLTRTTWRRVRTTALALLERTHATYWDSFPAMEVELAGEAVLREGEASAGVEVSGSDGGATLEPALIALHDGHALPTPRAHSPDGDARGLVRLTCGAQWRQFLWANMWELTAHATRDDEPTVSPASNARAAQEGRGRARALGATTATVASLHQGAGVDPGSLFGSTPIRVLVPAASSVVGDAAASHRTANDVAAVTGEAKEQGAVGEAQTPSESEDRVVAFRRNHSGAEVTMIPSGSPRTIREATLLPTRLSTTVYRFRVVQQAESLGGLFVHDSMRTVLDLAQHYLRDSLGAIEDADALQKINHPSRKGRHRDAGQLGGDIVVMQPNQRTRRGESSLSSPAALASPIATSSPSAIFGTAPRFHHAGARIGKEPNPFLPLSRSSTSCGMESVQHPILSPLSSQPRRRQWGVKDLQREDVLLFLIRYTHLTTELLEAIEAVEEHVQYLHRQLQLCPMRDMSRRCALIDLSMNVYPTIHLFLRFVCQQGKQSRGVLQLLSHYSGGTVHSGNIIDVYDAVGRCTGVLAAE